MGFKSKIQASYKIMSIEDAAFKGQHQKMIDDAADEMFKVKVAFENAKKKYEHVEEDNPAMDQEINRLEKEYVDAKKSYKNALETTLDDLKKDHAYEGWKANR